MRALGAARRAAAAAAAVMAYAAGWNYIFCALFITFDVLARSLFGFSSQATVEMTGYMLAAGIAWALAHTLAARAHIRVDVLVNRLAPRRRAALHIISLALLLGLGAFIAWAALELVDESALFQAHDNSAWRVAMVVPQGIWAFGICAFVVMAALLLAEAMLAALTGRPEAVDALLGARTIEDETAEALDAVAMAHEGEAPR